MGQDGTDMKAQSVRGSKASSAVQLSLLLGSRGAVRVVLVPHFLLPWLQLECLSCPLVQVLAPVCWRSELLQEGDAAEN